LHGILPEEKNIRVVSSRDSVTLSGTVSSVGTLAQALMLAEAYAPKKVVNLLQVGGVQQVMLEVRVAEMNRELLRRLGLNVSYLRGNDFAISGLNSLTSLVKPSDATLSSIPGAVSSAQPFAQVLSQSINALFRFQSGSAT